MSNVPMYQALAEAFAAEGVDTQFILMGDGNMHFGTAMKNLDGMATFSARQEHCACAMAMGYHLATGKVGVASVTCGPGFTQITTALAVAARGRIPLVVFAGEAPMHARWYNQALDQPPLAAATGAHYISAHSPRRMHQYVREAFYLARHERKPVVLGVPYDLQKEPLPSLGAYEPSSRVLPATEPIPPDPRQIDELVEKLAAAKCPVVLAGRGVMRAGAAAEVEQLADEAGALLSTTLLARGMFDHNPFSIGVAGGFARDIARELGEHADLVIAIGASLNLRLGGAQAARGRHGRDGLDLQTHRSRGHRQGLRPARRDRHRREPVPGAVRRLPGAGHRRALEHPRLRSGGEPEHAARGGARPRQDVRPRPGAASLVCARQVWTASAMTYRAGRSSGSCTAGWRGRNDA
jgi:thiamine pyrophosphate-dependent acetolactate synthase large subunit-like protein